MRNQILHELAQLDIFCREKNQIMAEHLEGTSAQKRALGSLLHDFYTCCERIFTRIAEEYDGGLPHGLSWHQQLLTQMALDLPESRPAVISQEAAQKLQDYLAFRHRFRNLYGFELEIEKMLPLLHGMTPMKERLSDEIRRFLARQEEVIRHGNERT